jgi:hypothetical protein
MVGENKSIYVFHSFPFHMLRSSVHLIPLCRNRMIFISSLKFLSSNKWKDCSCALF